MTGQIMFISADMELTQLVMSQTASLKLEVLSVKSLRDAVSILRHSASMSLMIVDLSLDDARIGNLIAKVRSMERFAEMPILVIAEIEKPEVLREALDAGATRYITRGFVSGSLRETLRELILLSKKAR